MTEKKNSILIIFQTWYRYISKTNIFEFQKKNWKYSYIKQYICYKVGHVFEEALGTAKCLLNLATC